MRGRNFVVSSVKEDRYKTAGRGRQTTLAKRGRLRRLQRIRRSVKIRGLTAKELMARQMLLRQEESRSGRQRFGLAVNRDHQK